MLGWGRPAKEKKKRRGLNDPVRAEDGAGDAVLPLPAGGPVEAGPPVAVLAVEQHVGDLPGTSLRG